ncbi:MAG: hypothetical protein H6Q26_3192, partial [Bacteroidetes bacterium]|nr:hypothetical protein [Bacteroidota bacterium]
MDQNEVQSLRMSTRQSFVDKGLSAYTFEN